MNYRIELLKERAETAATKCRAIAEKAAAENRGLTAAEKAVYDEGVRDLDASLAGIKAARADESFIAHARSEFAGLGAPLGSTKADHGLRLKLGREMAAAAATKIAGSKAMAVSGAEVVPQSFVGDPIVLGRPAQGLLDVVPVRQQSSPSFAYLRQISRDNQAAVVPEGDLKPTSDIGLERIEAQLAVIAHLSSPAPKFWFEDVVALQRFVEGEFQWGLAAAVEQYILDTVNETDGVQEQSYSASIVETLRHGITKLEVAGHQAVAAVMHPQDWAACELALASSSAIEYRGLPFDAATRRLFSVAVATTTAQLPGTAHIMGADAVVLDTDSRGVQVQWSENAGAETFARNETVLRVEGRYAVSVQAPLGVVVADIAGSGS